MTTARLIPAPDPQRERLDAGEAVAWWYDLELPTYEIKAPSQFPMYLDHRVYQGSSGKIYPIPFVEGVASRPEPRRWRAIVLENRYVQVIVLPELGGRIYCAVDKTTGYDFFYRNEVIKPALVGLGGPWISGGVEFNWPQHHRPATYLPTSGRIEEDHGTVTAWCSDHDPFTRMAAAHGVRLGDSSSVVEIMVELHNRTSQTETFLWWANAAVAVHDEYQVFFPPDVGYVADHARRALTRFPAADRPYYEYDYPAAAAERQGADRIDFYRNIPVPTSYMVVDSEGSFLGGYDHRERAGVVHVADPAISPGKKMWTWGNAPFGHAWDAQLTDANGPYVELMAGVYTDNQPDFSWLMPGETRKFSQHWFPVGSVGVVHAASVNAVMNVHIEGDRLVARCETTKEVSARLSLIEADGTTLGSSEHDFVPSRTLSAEFVLPEGTDASDVELKLETPDGELVSWRHTARKQTPPWTATEPPLPEEIDSVEELYLTGLHLFQNRHPTRSPLLYWEEALRRDDGDARTNTALANWRLARGQVETALGHAQRACDRVTVRNGNPRDCEPFFVRGRVLAALGRHREALTWFGKATWDSAWRGAALLHSAASHIALGEDREAHTAITGASPTEARAAALHAVLSRRLDLPDELDQSIQRWPHDRWLRYLSRGQLPEDGGELMDLAADLAMSGETNHALKVLQSVVGHTTTPFSNHEVLAHYIRAFLDPGIAVAEREAARDADRRWCFPHGRMARESLEAAVEADPSDGVARLLLGIQLYHLDRREDAVRLWEEADESGLEDVVLQRNLGLASYNVLHDDDRALSHYMRALELDSTDARLLYEFSELTARLGWSAQRRHELLSQRMRIVEERDDLVLELVRLEIELGMADQALERLESRQFRPWEGGEGQALAAWDAARAALGMERADPPMSLGEQRPLVDAPVAVHEDGRTDYFTTSLPQNLLFHR